MVIEPTTRRESGGKTPSSSRYAWCIDRDAMKGERIEVLRAVRPILATPMPAPRMLAQTARMLVPSLADYVVVDMVHGDRLECVEIAQADRAEVGRLAELRVVHAWPEGSVPLRAFARGEAVLARRVKRADFAFVRRRAVRACIAAPVRIEEETVALVTLVSCARAYAERDRAFAEELAAFLALGLDAHRARSAAQASVVRTGTAMRDEYLRAPPAFRISSPPPGLHFDLPRAVDEDVVRALDALGGAVDRLASSAALDPIAPADVRHVGAEARRIANAARDVLDWTALAEDLPLSLSLGPVDLGALVARAAARVGSARPLRVETVGAGALVADPRQLPTAIAHMVRAAAARSTGEIALRAELTDAELVVDVSGRRRAPSEAEDARDLSPWDLSVAAARRIVSAHGGRLETRAAAIRAQIPREIGDREEARRRSTVVGRS